MMRQILSAVADCHVHGIIHRDLKPENFLYLDETEGSLLKVTDFGLSEFFSLQSSKPFNDIAGSAFYVAPEVLSRKYGPSADLWSCGVIMYILLTGEVPFWGPTEAAIFREVTRGQLDLNRPACKTLSRSAKELMLSMLNRDHTVRPALVHPRAFILTARRADHQGLFIRTDIAVLSLWVRNGAPMDLPTQPDHGAGTVQRRQGARTSVDQPRRRRAQHAD